MAGLVSRADHAVGEQGDCLLSISLRLNGGWPRDWSSRRVFIHCRKEILVEFYLVITTHPRIKTALLPHHALLPASSLRLTIRFSTIFPAASSVSLSMQK